MIEKISSSQTKKKENFQVETVETCEHLPPDVVKTKRKCQLDKQLTCEINHNSLKFKLKETNIDKEDED